MKVIRFFYFNDWYEIDEQGRIRYVKWPTFSDRWVFLGCARHHAQTRPVISVPEIFRNPRLLEGAYGFDRDHGTRRAWRSSHGGKTARIHHPHLVELPASQPENPASQITS